MTPKTSTTPGGGTAAVPVLPMTAAQMAAETARELGRRGVAEAPRWADALAAHVLEIPTARLGEIADLPVREEQRARHQDLLAKVSADAPVAYLIGSAPFLGRDFEVTRDTLIPKRDTELFLQIVAEETRRDPLPPDPHVLEVCCGSGCVAVTLALLFPGATVRATDISPEALEVAGRNVVRHGLTDRVTLLQGDLLAPVADAARERPFDLIVSNPPYVPTGDIAGMGRHVADHEPHLALDGGADGLDFLRRILAEAPPYLAPGGRMFLEHEWHHGAASREAASAHPDYETPRTFADANGKDRALHVRRRPT